MARRVDSKSRGRVGDSSKTKAVKKKLAESKKIKPKVGAKVKKKVKDNSSHVKKKVATKKPTKKEAK